MKIPKPPAGGQRLLLPSHPKDFLRSCSCTLLSPALNTTKLVSPAKQNMWCSMPRTSFKRGVRNFHLARLCQGTLGPNPAQQTVKHDTRRLSLRNGTRQNEESLLHPCIGVYWKAVLLQPQKGISLSETKAFLKNVFWCENQKIPL